ncbi:MAG: fimbria/pilus outer membrane usher protein [Pseudomonadota bacterium]
MSLLQDDGSATRLRVQIPGGYEPDLGWSGTAGPGPYRLVLIWQGTDLIMDRALPTLPAGGAGPLQKVVLLNSPEASRLEMQISEPVTPSMRRIGDSWVLRLEPSAPARIVPIVSVAPVAAQPPIKVTPSATMAAAPLLATPPAPPPAAPAVEVAALTRPLPQAIAATAGRGKSSRVPDGPPQPEILLVDLVVNGQRQPDVARIEQWPDGSLLLAANTWTDARLTPLAQSRTLSDGSAAYAINAVPGATYRVNRQNLNLEINAPATAFIGSTMGVQGATAAPPPRPEPGVILNYDASLERPANGGVMTGGATLEAVAFSPWGSFVASALVRDDGKTRSFERLDTFWRYDMPERLESLVVGDTIGTAGGWSRPVRYGGIRWGRDFGMQPGFLTTPQLTLNGEAALPSTVEVLVNNARRMSQPLQPGPFELTNVPLVSGAGEINLVVRDLLGRETIVQQSYYSSPRLLARGLSDFSFEAGWLRTGYGVDSQYGDAFGAATWRQGLSDSLTGEGRVELQANRRAAGIELAGLLGNWAVGRMAFAASSGHTQGTSESGHMLQLGMERSSTSGGAALQYEYASQGFEPFGEGVGSLAVTQRTRERWLASIGGSIWKSVTGGVSYVRQTRWDGDQVQWLGLSVGMPLWKRASLSLALNKRLDGDHTWQLSATVSIPLDDGIYTSAQVNRSPAGKFAGVVSAARSAPAGPGLGWRVEGSSEESQRVRGSLQYNSNQAEFAADAASDAKGKVAVRAGVRGTLGLVAGLPFASRPIGQGSFAVVEVEGMAGIPVKRSNQVVAETDARGLAFVPGLLPWEKNQIEIDPSDLPLDTEPDNMVQQITPYARSGAVVKFAMRRSRQALVVLQQANGTVIPVGARVALLPSGAEFIAGRRGEVWLTGLAAGQQRMKASWPGGSCEVELQLPDNDNNMPAKIGPISCANN